MPHSLNRLAVVGAITASYLLGPVESRWPTLKGEDCSNSKAAAGLGETYVGDWVTCGADMATEMKCGENHKWQPNPSKKCTGDQGCKMAFLMETYSYTTECSSDEPPLKGFDQPWDWACKPNPEPSGEQYVDQWMKCDPNGRHIWKCSIDYSEWADPRFCKDGCHQGADGIISGCQWDEARERGNDMYGYGDA